MASIGEDFRAFLIGRPEVYALVNNRVHQDHVPQLMPSPDGYFDPYIWFESLGIGREECVNQSVGEDPDFWELDLECVAPDGRIAEKIVEVIRNLDGYHGGLGTRQTQGAFVDDQTDDYVPRNLRTDFGSFVKAVGVTIHKGS